MLGKCMITNADFRRNDLPTKNVEQYISGYLLRCQDYAKATDTLDSAKKNFFLIWVSKKTRKLWKIVDARRFFCGLRFFGGENFNGKC
ncbi:hypothetical protein JTB14_011182 [Gonioctena quinquepunctata]|nr:hypothetical protein JTB14_011182 [Gonioctena quinquepunctata]